MIVINLILLTMIFEMVMVISLNTILDSGVIFKFSYYTENCDMYAIYEM